MNTRKRPTSNNKKNVSYLSSPPRKVSPVYVGGAALAVILVAFLGLSVTFPTFRTTTTQFAAVLASVVIDLTNKDRENAHLPDLTENPILVAAAQAKANDMAAKGYFSHVSPDGRQPWHWFEAAGYAYQRAGENLAIDFTESSDVEAAWMHSPEHRANILNEHFTEVGVATAQGMYQGRPTMFVVQMFGKSLGAARVETAEVTTTGHMASSTVTVPNDPTQLAVAARIPADSVLGATTEATSTMPTDTTAPLLKQLEDIMRSFLQLIG